MPSLALREKCPYSELFWSAFSRICAEYGQFECGKIRTGKTPNTDTFYAVLILSEEISDDMCFSLYEYKKKICRKWLWVNFHWDANCLFYCHISNIKIAVLY